MRALDLYPANRVVLREVGLRDGLQLTKTFPDTLAKIAWMDAEHKAGVRHFEVGSFLPRNPTSSPEAAERMRGLSSARPEVKTPTASLSRRTRFAVSSLNRSGAGLFTKPRKLFGGGRWMIVSVRVLSRSPADPSLRRQASSTAAAKPSPRTGSKSGVIDFETLCT